MDERAFRLDGRAALVVGAGSGIGRAIALAFGAVGATVGCVDKSEETAQATMREIIAAGGKAEAIACDVTDEAAVSATVARFLAVRPPASSSMARPTMMPPAPSWSAARRVGRFSPST
jgi:NAD(P)-dependent dehydrogenase (short-subunit alcohol dehydrogenase family)